MSRKNKQQVVQYEATQPVYYQQYAPAGYAPYAQAPPTIPYFSGWFGKLMATFHKGSFFKKAAALLLTLVTTGDIALMISQGLDDFIASFGNDILLIPEAALLVPLIALYKSATKNPAWEVTYPVDNHISWPQAFMQTIRQASWLKNAFRLAFTAVFIGDPAIMIGQVVDDATASVTNDVAIPFELGAAPVLLFFIILTLRKVKKTHDLGWQQ